MSFIHDLYRGFDPAKARSRGLTIIGDKAPYVSPMSRTVVDGRTAHREHMKEHGVVEAGDMKPPTAGIDRAPMDRAGRDIVRAIQECSR